MSLLFEEENRDSLELQLAKAKKTILFLSAFVKKNALQWLATQLENSPEVIVTIVARWQPNDLISGSSDLSAYEFAKEQGWFFYVNNNMHYKIYLIDNASLSVGSANLTQKGLHIGIPGNDEASIQVTPSDIDIERLKAYVSGCCLVDDSLFSEIAKVIDEYDAVSKDESASIKWPFEIQQRLQLMVKHLWVNDLLFCSPFNKYEHDSQLVIHDSVLLGSENWHADSDKTALLASLRSRPAWQWLVRTVNESENEFVRFGEITSKLHDALLDDPKPYRKDVKELLSNLYEWVRYLDPPELGIRKFNYTEALYLK